MTPDDSLKADTLRRLWERTVIDGDCWVWQGALNGDGHGVISYRGGPRVIAKLSLFLAGKAEALAGRWAALRRCETAQCWNPDHLRVGTAAEGHLARLRARSLGPAQRPLNAAQVSMLMRLYYAKGWELARIAKLYGITSKRVDAYIQRENKTELEGMPARQFAHWKSKPHGMRAEVGVDSRGNLWWDAPT